MKMLKKYYWITHLLIHAKLTFIECLQYATWSWEDPSDKTCGIPAVRDLELYGHFGENLPSGLHRLKEGVPTPPPQQRG